MEVLVGLGGSTSVLEFEVGKHAFVWDLEAVRHTFALGHTFCWKHLEEGSC